MPAQEIFPRTIKNGHPAVTVRTKKPEPVSTIIAWCPIKGNMLFNRFPFSTTGPMPIIQNHTFRVQAIANRPCLFTIT
jgi:hypothetical protein